MYKKVARKNAYGWYQGTEQKHKKQEINAPYRQFRTELLRLPAIKYYYIREPPNKRHSHSSMPHT